MFDSRWSIFSPVEKKYFPIMMQQPFHHTITNMCENHILKLSQVAYISLCDYCRLSMIVLGVNQLKNETSICHSYVFFWVKRFFEESDTEKSVLLLILKSVLLRIKHTEQE